MKKLMAFIILFSAVAGAQTIAPLLTECGHKCDGQFSVTNNGLAPLAVTLEAFSFTLGKDGRSVFAPINPSLIELRMNEMSARVGPRDSHTFDYRMRCFQAPCMVTIFASAVVGHTREGIAIMTRLPAVVYQCSQAKDCRADTRRAAGLAN